MKVHLVLLSAVFGGSAWVWPIPGRSMCST